MLVEKRDVVDLVLLPVVVLCGEVWGGGGWLKVEYRRIITKKTKLLRIIVSRRNVQA